MAGANSVAPEVEHRGSTARDDHEVALVEAAVAGQADALERLVAQARDRVFRWAVGLLSDADQAEDATQQVLLRVWRHVGRLHDPRAFPAWLYRVTLNVCRERSKPCSADDVPLSQVDACVVAPGPTPDEIVAARGELARILSVLSEQDAVVIRMRFSDQRSAREIGGVLHISEGAVRARVHAAVKRLRAVLRRE